MTTRRVGPFLWIAATAAIALAVGGFLLFRPHGPAPVGPASAADAASVEYADVHATVAPRLRLETMPWSVQLPPDRADAFAALPGGEVVTRFRGVLFDAAGGGRLTKMDDDVLSVATVAGSLAVITGSHRLAYLGEDGLQDAGSVPIGASRLQSSADGMELLLLRDEEPYALAALDADGRVRPLTGSPERIDAVAGTAARHVFSIGRELYTQEASDIPAMVLRLPAQNQQIIGVAMLGDHVYFATRGGVYAIEGSLAVPVVIGFGGVLQLTGSGLLILNAQNGRLYRLVG